MLIPSILKYMVYKRSKGSIKIGNISLACSDIKEVFWQNSPTKQISLNIKYDAINKNKNYEWEILFLLIQKDYFICKMFCQASYLAKLYVWLWFQILEKSIQEILRLNSKQYQPSGEGGARLPPATPHCLQNPNWPPGCPQMADGVWKGVYP